MGREAPLSIQNINGSREVKSREGNRKIRINDGKPQDYLIRVNRHPVAADQVLQEGNRVSSTPTKIEEARRRVGWGKLAGPPMLLWEPFSLAIQPTRIPALPEETIEIGLGGPGRTHLHGQRLTHGLLRAAAQARQLGRVQRTAGQGREQTVGQLLRHLGSPANAIGRGETPTAETGPGTSTAALALTGATGPETTLAALAEPVAPAKLASPSICGL